MGAIVAWEYLLRKLPIGTHDWRMFLTPQEMDRIFKSCMRNANAFAFISNTIKSCS